LAKIKIEPGTDGYADSNKIADFVTKGNKLPDVEQDPKEVEAVEKTESKTSDKDYDWMK